MHQKRPWLAVDTLSPLTAGENMAFWEAAEDMVWGSAASMADQSQTIFKWDSRLDKCKVCQGFSKHMNVGQTNPSISLNEQHCLRDEKQFRR